jgi:hypothetical protein
MRGPARKAAKRDHGEGRRKLDTHRRRNLPAKAIKTTARAGKTQTALHAHFSLSEKWVNDERERILRLFFVLFVASS